MACRCLGACCNHSVANVCQPERMKHDDPLEMNEPLEEVDEPFIEKEAEQAIMSNKAKKMKT